MSVFTYSTDVSVRFQDLDLLNHVNNVAYAAYLEQARIEFFEDAVGLVLGESDEGFAIVHLELDYERPIKKDDDVKVLLRVLELGTSSIPIEYEVRADGRVAATAKTIVVPFHDRMEESFPIPSVWRPKLEQYQQSSE